MFHFFILASAASFSSNPHLHRPFTVFKFRRGHPLMFDWHPIDSSHPVHARITVAPATSSCVHPSSCRKTLLALSAAHAFFTVACHRRPFPTPVPTILSYPYLLPNWQHPFLPVWPTPRLHVAICVVSLLVKSNQPLPWPFCRHVFSRSA